MPKPRNALTATFEDRLVLIFIHKPKLFDEMVGEHGTSDDYDFWCMVDDLMLEHMKQPHCLNCGSTSVHWIEAVRGQREQLTGIPLEPNDPAEWCCESCGSNEIKGDKPCPS